MRIHPWWYLLCGECLYLVCFLLFLFRCTVSPLVVAKDKGLVSASARSRLSPLLRSLKSNHPPTHYRSIHRSIHPVVLFVALSCLNHLRNRCLSPSLRHFLPRLRREDLPTSFVSTRRPPPRPLPKRLDNRKDGAVQSRSRTDFTTPFQARAPSTLCMPPFACPAKHCHPLPSWQPSLTPPPPPPRRPPGSLHWSCLLFVTPKGSRSTCSSC